MQVVTGNRGSGKTTKLFDMAIQDALNEPRMKILLVTPDSHRADIMYKRLCESLDYEAIKDNISIMSFANSNNMEHMRICLMGKHFHRIYFDDLDSFIEKIFFPYLKTSPLGLDPICVSIDTTTPFEKTLIIEHKEDRYEPRLDVSPYY